MEMEQKALKKFLDKEHCTLGQKIDHGSFGVVWEVIMTKSDSLKQKFAVKQIESTKYNSSEFKISNQLHSDHCVKLLEPKKAKWYHFLRMELCMGDLTVFHGDKSLSKFSNKQVKNIVHQLLKGLKHMHSKNIVHRDLKPGNILFDTKGIFKICDFGHAMIFGDYSMDPFEFGAIISRGPEVLARVEDFDSRVDIWAMGVLLYQLIATIDFYKGVDDVNNKNVTDELEEDVDDDMDDDVDNKNDSTDEHEYESDVFASGQFIFDPVFKHNQCHYNINQYKHFHKCHHKSPSPRVSAIYAIFLDNNYKSPTYNDSINTNINNININENPPIPDYSYHHHHSRAPLSLPLSLQAIRSLRMNSVPNVSGIGGNTVGINGSRSIGVHSNNSNNYNENTINARNNSSTASSSSGTSGTSSASGSSSGSETSGSGTSSSDKSSSDNDDEEIVSETDGEYQFRHFKLIQRKWNIDTKQEKISELENVFSRDVDHDYDWDDGDDSDDNGLNSKTFFEFFNYQNVFSSQKFLINDKISKDLTNHYDILLFLVSNCLSFKYTARSSAKRMIDSEIFEQIALNQKEHESFVNLLHSCAKK